MPQWWVEFKFELLILFWWHPTYILLPKLFWRTARKTFEIQGWKPRTCKIFEITWIIYSNSERSEQFLVLFLLVPGSFSHQKISTIIVQIGKNYWNLEICRKSKKKLFFPNFSNQNTTKWQALNFTTMIKQQFLLVVPNICTKHLHNTRSASKVYAYHSYKS